jgi:hypothetical protein
VQTIPPGEPTYPDSTSVGGLAQLFGNGGVLFSAITSDAGLGDMTASQAATAVTHQRRLTVP